MKINESEILLKHWNLKTKKFSPHQEDSNLLEMARAKVDIAEQVKSRSE